MHELLMLLSEIAFIIVLGLFIYCVVKISDKNKSVIIEGVNDRSYPLGSVVRFKKYSTIYMIVGYSYQLYIPKDYLRKHSHGHYETYTYCVIPCYDYYRDKNEILEKNKERFETFRKPFNKTDVEEVIYCEKNVHALTSEIKIIKKKPLEQFDESTEYLPLGSIVKIFDTDTLFMIIERKMNELGEMYDYKSVPYPEGFRGKNNRVNRNAFQYFNHTDIEEVKRIGYTKK